MGLGRHGGGRYVTVANGKLNLSQDGKKEQFDWFEGKLVGIRCFEDEFEGQPVPKVELTMVDEAGERHLIRFGQESWYSYGFFARLPQIDVTKPFRLGVMQSEQNEKVSFCWMRQGEKIKADKDGTPKPDKRTIGKKTVVDWTAFDEHVENIVLDVAIKLGVPASPAGVPAHEDGDFAGDEDLPF